MPYTQGSFNQEDNWKIYDAVTSGGGGGAGTASAFNQDIQISQLTEGGGETPSVFKEAASGESVFLPAGVNILSKIDSDLTSIEAALAVISGQMVEGSAIPSVFKNSSDVGVFLDAIADQSVFLAANKSGVFYDKQKDSVFTAGADKGVPVFSAFDINTGEREGVFHDTKNNRSVFKANNGQSVLISGLGASLAELTQEIKDSKIPKSTTEVVYLSAASPTLLAAALETYLRSISYIPSAPKPQIISINFERDTTLHGCYLTYNV